MSGSLQLPESVALTQADVGPQVTVTQAGTTVLPPGVPPFPLAADPSQTWDLQDVNGVLIWVQFTAPPTQTAIGLEDGAGALQLEDGDDYIVMEF